MTEVARDEACSVVSADLVGASAEWSGTVVLAKDDNWCCLETVLEIGAHGLHEDEEEVLGGRTNTDARRDADEQGADVE